MPVRHAWVMKRTFGLSLASLGRYTSGIESVQVSPPTPLPSVELRQHVIQKPQTQGRGLKP